MVPKIKKGKSFLKIPAYVKKRDNKLLFPGIIIPKPEYTKTPKSGSIPVFEPQIAYLCEGCEGGCMVVLHPGCTRPDGMKKNPCHLLREIRTCEILEGDLIVKAFSRFRC